MQSELIHASAIEKHLAVNIPYATVMYYFMKKLKEKIKNTNIKGFRPGKIPITVAAEHWGTEIMAEVVGYVSDISLTLAMSQHNIAPICPPSFLDYKFDQEKGLRFTAIIPSFPEITSINLPDKTTVINHWSTPEDISDEDFKFGVVEVMQHDLADYQTAEKIAEAQHILNAFAKILSQHLLETQVMKALTDLNPLEIHELFIQRQLKSTHDKQCGIKGKHHHTEEEVNNIAAMLQRKHNAQLLRDFVIEEQNIAPTHEQRVERAESLAPFMQNAEEFIAQVKEGKLSENIDHHLKNKLLTNYLLSYCTVKPLQVSYKELWDKFNQFMDPPRLLDSLENLEEDN